MRGSSPTFDAAAVPAFRVTVTLRNNVLARAREARGITMREAAESADVHYTIWWRLETLRLSPVIQNRKHEASKVERDERPMLRWRPAALKIARFLKVPEDVLWPDAVRAVRQPVIVAEVEASQLGPALTSAQFERRVLGQGVSDPEKTVIDEHARLALRRAVLKLDARAREIVTSYYGLETGQRKTLSEVGDAVGVSRERVRQVLNMTLPVLRKNPDLRAHLYGEGSEVWSQIAAQVRKAGEEDMSVRLSEGRKARYTYREEESAGEDDFSDEPDDLP